jgi:hypothetical protein
MNTMFFALLSLAALAEDATPAPIADVAKASFASTAQAMTVAVIEGRATGTGYAGGTTVTVQTTYYRDLCVTPCTVELKPGIHEMVLYGNGRSPVSGKYSFSPSSQSTFQVEPRSNGLRTLSLLGAATGLTAALMGGLFYAIEGEGDGKYRIMPASTEKQLIGGGLVLTAVGGFGMVKNQSKLTLQPGAGAVLAP